MPVVPFTHHHRRHPIADYLGPTDDADALAQFDHDRSVRDRDDRPVTVAELLDAYLNDSVGPDEYGDILDRAPDDVFDRFLPVAEALDGDRDPLTLSPEERAEFDRRTSG